MKLLARWIGLLLVGGILLAMGSAESRAGCTAGVPRQVVDALVNEDLDRAATLVAGWQKAAPGDPLPAVYRAMVTVVKAFHTDASDRRRQLMKAALRQAEAAARPVRGSVLDDGDESPRQRLARGYALSIQAALQYQLQHERKAYDLGYRGHRLLQEAVDDDPALVDAYLPLGLYEYYLGTLPEEKRGGARMLDMQGDAGLGIEYLERAVRDAPTVAPEAARVLLVQLGLPDAELCRYRILAQQMHRRYPGNRVLGLVARIVPLQCRMLESEGKTVPEDEGLQLPARCGQVVRNP